MACFYGPNKAPNGPNYTRYSNFEFDQEYTSLMSVTNPIKKEKLITKMENILHDDQPFILLFYDESIWLRLPLCRGKSVPMRGVCYYVFVRKGLRNFK